MMRSALDDYIMVHYEGDKIVPANEERPAGGCPLPLLGRFGHLPLVPAAPGGKGRLWGEEEVGALIRVGLALGSMYGLLALGFHVTHAVSRTVNFAQGSTMMLGAVLCFTFWVTLGLPLALAVVLALAACALWGVVVERVAVRPFVARGSNSWLIATVALGIVLENVVLFTFGKDPRGMPPAC